MQLSNSVWQRLTRRTSLKKSKFGELKTRVIFEFRSYVDPEFKDAAADSEDSVEEGELEEDDLEEMIVDDGTSNKACYSSTRRAGNDVSLTDMGMSSPFYMPPIGQQNILCPSIPLF